MTSGICAGPPYPGSHEDWGGVEASDGDRLWEQPLAAGAVRWTGLLEVVVLPVGDMAGSVAIDRC
jgi:hypothetical protein